MRVGFLTSDLGHQNGWAHYSLETVHALQQAGIDPVVVAASNHSGDVPFPITPILPTVSPPDRNRFLKLLRALPQVRNLFQTCDIIHSTVEPYAPLGAMVAGKRPFVQGGVGSYLRVDHWTRFPLTPMYHWAFNRSQIVTISHFSASVVKDVFPQSNPVAIPLAIDATRFVDIPKKMPEKSGQIILSSGGVKARKGTIHTIRAMAKVREELPDVRCVILGSLQAEPNYVTQVQAEIDRLDLQDQVQLLGYVSEEDLLGWLAVADVYVLPSMNASWKFEGFGLVHLEASACGIPTIGTWGCGAEDAIDDGVTGYLVTQDKVNEELPQAILRVLQNPKLAQQLGTAGKRKAQNRTWTHVAQEMIAVYERLLS